MLFKSIQTVSNNIARNLKQQAYKAIDNNLSTMADLNVAQMEKGLNSDGTEIGSYVSEPYARFKKAIGSIAPFGVVDLKFEGNLHSRTFAKRNGDNLVFGSTDEKTKQLKEKYDSNGEIFGLTKDNQIEVTDQILAETFDYVTQQIQQI